MTEEEQKAEWHKLRSTHVGGSEIGILMGETSFGRTKFQLWHEKKGTVERKDLSSNDRVTAGNFMEPAIAAWASSYFGTPLTKANCYVQHPTVPGMGSTPDYFRSGTTYPVEIKNVDGLQFYKEWEAVGDVITDAPIGYILQAMYTAECLGEPESELIAGIGGNRLAKMTIPRREDIVVAMKEAVTDFWKSIAENKPPEPDYKMDAETISRLRCKGNKTPVDMSENEKLMALCQDYEAAKVWADSWKKEKAGISAQILEICNGHNVVMCGSHKVSISDIPDVREKTLEITPDLIGTTVTLSKAKKGYPRLNVKDTAKPPEGDDSDE